MANTLQCPNMILAHLSRSLLIALFALALAAPASQAGECQCGCSAYYDMLESIERDAGQWPAKLDRCAGACATAWSQCEISQNKSERLAAAESDDSESDADTREQDNDENDALSH